MEENSEPVLPYSFVSNHEGFLGTIKICTQDFVVTEIDINGQLVTKANDGSPPGQLHKGSEKCHNPKRPRIEVNTLSSLEPGSEKATTIQCGTDQGKDDKSELLQSDSFDLSIILGPSVSEELELFTTALRLEGKAPVRDGDDDGDGAKTGNGHLSLGTFTDKTQRASVHRAVRHNYPFLMTVTNQAEILVKEDSDFKKLSSLVSEEECEDFFRFIDAKVSGSTFTFKPDASKEHRTSVHHFLSGRFGKLVETKSFTNQNGSAITVRLRERGRPNKKRPATDAEGEDITYTGFTLRKENLETLEVISYMAAALGVLPSHFTYAGIKDKRAITYQNMVVKNMSPPQLKEKASEFEPRGISLSHIRAASEPLHLGRLQGNHFDLVVRELRLHRSRLHGDLEKLVNEAVENAKLRGFVNYYGPQRFGSAQSIQADRVGLALLKENMEAAIKLFFTPDDEDDLPNKAKRHFLNTGNAKESLALMPGYKARERLMLRALHRYGAGPEGSAHAWLSLPHGMRVFYLHAYCSRVWNDAAAHRLRTLGAEPAQGDLVWAAAGETAEAGTPTQIHVVTAAEAEEGVFSLEQVVLPMPGNTVRYPENLLGQWYRERLAQDGLGSCRFRVPALKLNVPGCYRPLLARAHNLTHTLLTHHREEEEEEDTRARADDDDGQSKQTHTPSLSLSFDLDASCYATVFLREVMRCDL
ncbi:pseudouridylate synthase 7 homolog-like protein [Alosa sapidissima]|uniref:pseudouridylate synthase 7 homolog-like protein n=1 Tax=Alosa sapidissima TaxID=34773 RepID=UPI001C0A270C|nr:pseudouridylate synthase 7 homolog-like protein [Alosa sapidissima]